MSYLLLNEEMAMRTNLIPHPDGKIQDVYTDLLQDFKEFIHHRINDKVKIEIIESKLDRKLIKLIFMKRGLVLSFVHKSFLFFQRRQSVTC